MRPPPVNRTGQIQPGGQRCRVRDVHEVAVERCRHTHELTGQRVSLDRNSRSPARRSSKAVIVSPAMLWSSSMQMKIRPVSNDRSTVRSNPVVPSMTRMPPQLMPKVSAKYPSSGWRRSQRTPVMVVLAGRQNSGLDDQQALDQEQCARTPGRGADGCEVHAVVRDAGPQPHRSQSGCDQATAGLCGPDDEDHHQQPQQIRQHLGGPYRLVVGAEDGEKLLASEGQLP